MAFDARSGKQVWEVPALNPEKSGSGYGSAMCQPVLMRVGGETCIFARPDGYLVRVRDGKALISRVGWQAACSGMLANESGDTVYMFSHAFKWNGVPADRILPAKEDCIQAIRFTPDGPDKVKAEQLWVGPGLLTHSCPVLLGNRLFAILADNKERDGLLSVLDVSTGKMISSKSLRRRNNKSGDVWWTHDEGLNVLTAAGGNLYTFDAGRNSTALGSVFKADETLQVVTHDNHLLGGYPADRKPFSDYWGRLPEAFTGPYFSGNRMFVRAHEQVYCIGDPKEPMRLSKVHQ
jgi:hypothetical protein